jgi:hypothetical protein
MPLQFSDEELALLQTLSAPIAPRQREGFLREVAAELAFDLTVESGEAGLGRVHRVAREVQRRYTLGPQPAVGGK